MGNQSTRHKIRRHATSAVNQIENCLYHLQCIDTIATNRSTIIDSYMPSLVEMLVGVRKVLEDFEKEL